MSDQIIPPKPLFRQGEVRRIEEEFGDYALYALGRGEITPEEAAYIHLEWCRDNLIEGMPKTFKASCNPVYRRGLKGVLEAKTKRRKYGKSTISNR